jgi:hypothetical protein
MSGAVLTRAERIARLNDLTRRAMGNSTANRAMVNFFE